ncbi:hypothetical protein [Reyranella sp.]|uniref:hypothetical protein n=1 Tax=Reyranella sp. TaxID=1929291 RepID=UPI00272F9F98|nr:hypothetical protein [Reyranella sp.]MDP2374269.1 hypothetical protein [Reyranella sp.]
MDEVVTISFERAILPQLLHGLHSRRMTQSRSTCDLAALDRAMEAVKAAIEGETDGE